MGLEERLRGAGLRVTASRLAVLQVLGAATDHPDVEQIVGRARRQLGSVSTQAVYDILEALHQAGLVRRIEPAGGPARYEARVGDNHHHLVCRLCHRTVDVDCAVGRAPCLKPVDAQDFAVDEAEVTYWGVCPTCQTAANNSPR